MTSNGTAEPRASTGRLTVHPGDTIASTWGNTTFDQTMEVFDTAAARDSQWATPHDGALAYTIDTQTPWIRKSGAWIAWAALVPAQATGSATVVFSASSSSALLTVNFPAGRFTTAPKVMAIMNATGGLWTVVSSITATNFVVRGLSNVSITASPQVDWYATAAV